MSAPQYSESDRTFQDGRVDTFVLRVSSLPLVHDSLSHLHSAVNSTSVGRFAYKHANAFATTVYKDSEPLFKKAQPQLKFFDNYANKGLDIVEKRVPIIKKPTGDIIAQARKPADDAYSTVTTTAKTYVDSFNNTVDKRFKTPAKNIYSHRFEPIFLRVDSNFSPLVDQLESTVHKYVPVSEQTKTNGGVNPVGKENVKQTQFSRVYGLSRETSSYLFQASQKQIQDLQQSNALLKQATETITSLNEKLQATIKDVREKDTVSARVHALSSNIIAELDAIQAYVKDNASKFPAVVQDRLHPFTDFFSARYTDIKTEVSKEGVSPVQKAKNVVHVTSEQTIPVLQQGVHDLQALIQQYISLGQKKATETKDAAANGAEKVKKEAEKTSQQIKSQ